MYSILHTRVCRMKRGSALKSEVTASSSAMRLNSCSRAGNGEPVTKRRPPSNLADPTRETLTSGCFYFNEVQLLPTPFNSASFSLSELISRIRPILSIHFNYMVDLQWLLHDLFAECLKRTGPIRPHANKCVRIVKGGSFDVSERSDSGNVHYWNGTRHREKGHRYPSALRKLPIAVVVGEKTGTTPAELREEAREGGWENVTVGSARLPIPWGVHHSKLSLFEDGDGAVHVIVSTANLVPGDWHAKTQMFYYMSGVSEGDEVSEGQPLIAQDLLQYLLQYNLEQVAYWTDRLKFIRFAPTSDRIIYSFPGYHKGQIKNTVGHLALRAALRDKARKETNNQKLLILQCSSIGSLGGKAETWLLPQFCKSLRGEGNSSCTRVFLVFPTVKDVQASFEGCAAGGSLPYRRETDDRQPWLRPMMCKWKADTWGRTQAMPHVKCYTQISHERKPEWQLVTSANLSKAAWGEEQKEGTQIAIRSYEVGVLVVDEERIRLPFDYPLVRYGKDDRPWIVDDMQQLMKEELLASRR